MIKRPDIYFPKLQFRYTVDFLDYPETKISTFTGYSIDLPKWTIRENWGNPIKIQFYTFELVQAIESLMIDISRRPLGNSIRINLLKPNSEPSGYWDVFGDVQVIDFGHLTWKNDDIVSVEMIMLPTTCKYTNLVTYDGQATE